MGRIAELLLGAPIDEVTNVFTLGALAHTLLRR